MPENLWPTDFGEVAQKTPVAILREQANALGDRTANIVVGKVSMSLRPSMVALFMSLTCIPLRSGIARGC